MLESGTDSCLRQKIDVLITFILMIILFFTPLAGGTETGVSVSIAHALVFVLLFLWMLEMLIEKKADLARTYLDYPILAFVILSVLSATFSVSPRKSFWTILNFFDYIALYYIVVNKIKDRKQINLLMYAVISAGSLVALSGILKYLKTSGDMLRFTYYNPNPLGAYLAMVLPVALVIMALTQDLGKKILIGYCICMVMTGFILTLSRGGWFSLLFALLLMGYLYQKKSGGLYGRAVIPMLLIAGAALMCILILGYVNIKHEILGLNKKRIESVSGRVPIWKGTFDMIRTHALLGTGPGTFPLLCDEYMKKYFAHPLRDKYAHSEYLQTVSEWGVFSLLIILWIQTCFFFETFKMYMQARTRFSQYLRLGIIGSMVAVSIHSMAEFTLHPMANAILCVVLGGIVIGNGKCLNGKCLRVAGDNGRY